jgi:hypothetical protein
MNYPHARRCCARQSRRTPVVITQLVYVHPGEESVFDEEADRSDRLVLVGESQCLRRRSKDRFEDK